LLTQETRARLLLRAVVLVAPVLALLAAGPADRPRGWFLLLTLVLSVGFAAMPESALGTACLGLVVLWWALAADGVPLTAIPAALLLVAAHVAAVLLAYGPTAMPTDAALLARWARRAGGVGLAVPAVWLFAVAVDDQPEPPGIWLAALATATLGCVAAATAVTMREQR
jgi:hypothetical protein